MKIAIRQFLSKNHSWSIVGQSIARELIKQNHQVELFSTDGKNVPKDLQNNLVGYSELNSPNTYGKEPENADIAIAYTAMHNFQKYLKTGKKKFGIWCYEWIGKNSDDVLPSGFAANHIYCDKILAPSNFAKQVFLNGNIPDNKIEVIPHGIGKEYLGNSKLILPTRKSFKILANIAQNHKRKNIPGLLKAFGKAFTKKDDVCLILKAKDKPIEQGFDVSLKLCLKHFYDKYPKHAELKLIDYWLDDMSALYRSIDCTFTMSRAECAYLPFYESVASGKINIASNWGGYLDHANNENCLLVNGKIEKADPTSLYWEPNENAIHYEANIDDAVDKLRFVYQNFQSLNQKLEDKRENFYQEFSWSNITNRILKL
jgi:glycosyltransferase involved in cell wall biosynthesis